MSWIRAEAEIAAADGCEIALVAYTLNFGEITSLISKGGGICSSVVSGRKRTVFWSVRGNFAKF